MVWRNAKAVTTPTPGTLISRLVVSSPGHRGYQIGAAELAGLVADCRAARCLARNRSPRGEDGNMR